jgi:hypothetical protein
MLEAVALAAQCCVLSFEPSPAVAFGGQLSM